jgi:antitoxin component YwqK of YwqJK toxin-antitoxin module
MKTFKLFFESKEQKYTLKLGKYKLFTDAQGTKMSYEDAVKNKVISTPTRRNAEFLQTKGFIPEVVYKIPVDDLTKRSSFYITFKKDNEQYVLARKETARVGAGSTKFYSKNEHKPFSQLSFRESYDNDYDIEKSNRVITFYKKGTDIIHRLFGPAIIRDNSLYYWYNNGKLYCQIQSKNKEKMNCSYDNNGILSTVYITYKNANKQSESLLEDGDLYTSSYWYENGQKQTEQWYKDGNGHRLDGPAHQQWDENGQKRTESWYKDGNLYRLDGPAVQAWYEDGQKSHEAWYKDNELHRLDGPAYQVWDENGNKIKEKYYIDGKELLPNEFKHLTKQYDKEELDILNDLNS